MKKILITAIVCLLLGGTSLQAQDVSVGLQWDPPTTRIADTDCAVQGAAITPAEAATLEYTVSYRVRDSGAAWTNIETTAPTVALDGLSYSTWYEAVVGAHWPGQTVLCATEILQFETEAGPPPSGCNNLRVVGP